MNKNALKSYLIAATIIGSLFVIAIVVTYLNHNQKNGLAINGSNLVKIIGPNVMFAQITSDGKNIYYFNTKDSRFYRYQTSSQQNTALYKKIPAPTEVDWSPKFDKVYVTITYKSDFNSTNSPFADTQHQDGDPANWMIDFTSNKTFELNDFIQTMDWSPNDNQIVYNYFGPTENSISISDSDGRNYKKILDLDPEIYAISAGVKALGGNKILYFPIVSEKKGGIVTVYDLESGKSQNIVSDSTASVIILSPDKQNIFCNIYTNEKNIPTIINLTTGQKTTINTIDLLTAAWAADSKSILGLGLQTNNQYNILQIGLDGKIQKTYINSVVNIQKLFAPSDDSGIYIASENSIYKLKSSKK